MLIISLKYLFLNCPFQVNSPIPFEQCFACREVSDWFCAGDQDHKGDTGCSFCHLGVAVPLSAAALELLLVAFSVHMWCFETCFIT